MDYQDDDTARLATAINVTAVPAWACFWAVRLSDKHGVRTVQRRDNKHLLLEELICRHWTGHKVSCADSPLKRPVARAARGCVSACVRRKPAGRGVTSTWSPTATLPQLPDSQQGAEPTPPGPDPAARIFSHVVFHPPIISQTSPAPAAPGLFAPGDVTSCDTSLEAGHFSTSLFRSGFRLRLLSAVTMGKNSGAFFFLLFCTNAHN